jgi:LytS/YehU family sensor histidine kinase
MQMVIITAIPLSLKFVRRFYRLQDEKNKLAKLNTELELNFLRSQINPHFLFNTLNNIYSLALQQSDKTPGMIIKLSDLMRYILYECDVERISLEKEVAIMKDYVELEKLRHGENVQIDFEVEGDLKGKTTPPLLLIHFVENAFKHGVNAQFGRSFVKMRLYAGADSLQFHIVNNKPPNNRQNHTAGGGIGLENIRKRLQLIYPGKHSLTAGDEPDLFQVELTVQHDEQ